MADLWGESAALLQGANTAASNYNQNQTAEQAERSKLFLGGQNNLTGLMQQVISDQARLKQQSMQDQGMAERQKLTNATALDQERIQQTGGLMKQAMQDKANMITIDPLTAKHAARAYKTPELEQFAGVEMPLNKWSAIQKAAADELASKTKESKGSGVQDRFESAQERRRQNDVLAYTEKLEKNPQYMKLQDQEVGLSQIPTLIKMIEDGNTVAASALGIKMAKGLGEVGVMTEKDVVRYIRSGQLTQKAGDVLLTWLKGKPTDATLAEVNQVSGAIRTRMQEKMQEVYGKYVNRLSRNYKIPAEEAAFLMDVPYDPAYENSSAQNSNGGSGGGQGGGGAGQTKGDPLGIRDK